MQNSGEFSVQRKGKQSLFPAFQINFLLRCRYKRCKDFSRPGRPAHQQMPQISLMGIAMVKGRLFLFKIIKCLPQDRTVIVVHKTTAIHRYDIKTNEGAAYQTTYTNIDELKASGKLPAEENFIKDEWTTDKIAIDMSGMMEGNIVYTDSYYNSVLSTWLNVDTSTMPPIYTMSNQVYLIRLKNNTYAAIRFTNYTNAKGIKGYIDFDFLYPFDFEENN